MRQAADGTATCTTFLLHEGKNLAFEDGVYFKFLTGNELAVVVPAAPVDKVDVVSQLLRNIVVGSIAIGATVADDLRGEGWAGYGKDCSEGGESGDRKKHREGCESVELLIDLKDWMGGVVWFGQNGKRL